MSRCNACMIEVSDTSEKCPLCHTVLEKDDKVEDWYPDIKVKTKKMNYAFRIILFIWIITTAICVFINYNMPTKYMWSIAVAAILAYPIFILYELARDKGYLHRIFFIMITGVLLVALVDYIFGAYGWSVDYILPGALAGVDIVFIILMFTNRRNWQTYMMPQLFVIVLGVITLILIKTGVVKHPLMSEIAFLSAVLVFLGTLILGGRTARMELRRRFHIN